MIATRAMQQALCRGIVKPTPVRGRYRYTEFGVNYQMLKQFGF
jgi:hypothetical protein